MKDEKKEEVYTVMLMKESKKKQDEWGRRKGR